MGKAPATTSNNFGSSAKFSRKHMENHSIFPVNGVNGDTLIFFHIRNYLANHRFDFSNKLDQDVWEKLESLNNFFMWERRTPYVIPDRTIRHVQEYNRVDEDSVFSNHVKNYLKNHNLDRSKESNRQVIVNLFYLASSSYFNSVSSENNPNFSLLFERKDPSEPKDTERLMSGLDSPETRGRSSKVILSPRSLEHRVIDRSASASTSTGKLMNNENERTTKYGGGPLSPERRSSISIGTPKKNRSLETPERRPECHDSSDGDSNVEDPYVREDNSRKDIRPVHQFGDNLFKNTFLRFKNFGCFDKIIKDNFKIMNAPQKEWTTKVVFATEFLQLLKEDAENNWDHDKQGKELKELCQNIYDYRGKTDFLITNLFTDPESQVRKTQNKINLMKKCDDSEEEEILPEEDHLIESD